MQPGDVEATWADTTKLEALVGTPLRFTPLAERLSLALGPQLGAEELELDAVGAHLERRVEHAQGFVGRAAVGRARR